MGPIAVYDRLIGNVRFHTDSKKSSCRASFHSPPLINFSIRGWDLYINPWAANGFPLGKVGVGLFEDVNGILHGQDLVYHVIINHKGHITISSYKLRFEVINQSSKVADDKKSSIQT
jgi:hypothetical protein